MRMTNWNLKKTVLLVSIVILVGLGIWTLWGNTALGVTEYEIISDRLPQNFDGFRIAQISDLHNAQFGEKNARLIKLLSQTAPDMIVITGDLIDSRRTDIKIALEFAQQAVSIAPVYYVSGNHEARVDEYIDLKKGLADAGVTVLENQKIQISSAGVSFTLIGIDDPSFRTDYLLGDSVSVVRQALSVLQDHDNGYTVLLSHRPELFDVYVDAGMDLVFSGHAHGGQFRLPFVGGLVAPHQGFFPKYDAGQFTEKNTVMLVSRGVGNSICPIRFNNRPEIIIAELKSFESFGK